jgi:hypothetical protein
MVAPTPSEYSATVRLELVIGADRLPLAQIGGGRLMFGREVVLPGTGGRLIAYIDENVQEWDVTWEARDQARRTWVAEYREVEYTPTTGATAGPKA